MSDWTIIWLISAIVVIACFIISCVSTYNYSRVLPSRGDVVLFTALAFIPLTNVVIAVLLLILTLHKYVYLKIIGPISNFFDAPIVAHDGFVVRLYKKFTGKGE